MGSCEDIDLQTLDDCDYVKHGFCIWINNEPAKAIDFLDKRKEKLSVEYVKVLLKFFNALISFDRNKITEVSTMLRDLEQKCSPEQGWFNAIRTKLFGQQRESSKRKSILEELERKIILADTLLCSSILTGISCDVSSYIKAAMTIRKSWKIYSKIFNEIQDLCKDSPQMGKIGSLEYSILNHNNQELSSPTSSECSNWTVPSLTDHYMPQNSSVINKSRSTIFSMPKARLRKPPMLLSFAPKSESLECDISMQTFKDELHRLRGAIFFGYGALHIAFSFIPPQLKVFNLLGCNGDLEFGLQCLRESRDSQDVRSMMSTIVLLYYYLIVVPFFSVENSDLRDEITAATKILNDNEKFDQSALFLFFSGRRQRLKKKIQFAIMHYDAALRVNNLPRELKMLVMHELGICLLVELNFHDAMHYFNELRVSKFSKSFYYYLSTICQGAITGTDENLKFCKENLQKLIYLSPQKEGTIEKFLMNRSKFAIPEGDCETAVYWRLLCYEIMYLWNLLGSSSSNTLEKIIEDCHNVDSSKPILGLNQLLKGAIYKILKDYEKAINCYNECIQICCNNPSELHVLYIPAYANYELADILMKNESGETSKGEACKLVQKAQTYKNFDFEHRLKLKLVNLKTC